MLFQGQLGAKGAQGSSEAKEKEHERVETEDTIPKCGEFALLLHLRSKDCFPFVSLTIPGAQGWSFPYSSLG